LDYPEKEKKKEKRMSDPITQLSTSINTASTLCAEIKKTRHIGKSHTQLDLLEASLASADFLPLSSSLSLSDEAKAELEQYVDQMGEINARLEHIAHPDRKKHRHGHHHHEKKRSLLFPDWDPVRHEHKEVEDPHFGDLR
jgi:hypothetical protein